ncbi:MAG: lipoyl(octanoyl) transferase LipB [Clostridia bacterium]|nr:lipoyl(octanoyl) transferase LipB [Clostridia bacterium]
MRNITYKNLGKIGYQEAWDYQEVLFKELLDAKRNGKSPNGYLLFCEHNPVFTLGKSGSESNLLMNEAFLAQKGIEFFKINRGGDITFHGPQQVVGYPIIDLEQYEMGVKQYIESMEEVIIKTLKEYSIESERLEGATGVWLDTNSPNVRKICAIGVKASRYVTMHGFAFNVNTDLNYYSYINPCGFTDKTVTSMQKELGKEVNFEEAKMKLQKNFAKVFGMNFI